MDYFHLLTRVGLTKKEASIYIALLDYGASTLSEISHRTHINRPALYATLPVLIEKGLVSTVVRGRRTQYLAEPVDKVLAMYTSEQKKVVSEFQIFKDAYAKRTTKRPVVKYFEGLKGMDFVFDDVISELPTNGIFYRYSARTGPKAERFSHSHYSDMREKKHIERFVITSEDKAQKKESKLNRHVASVPQEFDFFDDNVSLLIYGNKTAYIDYGSETSVIVESPEIARFQEKLFRLLWKYLRNERKKNY